MTTYVASQNVTELEYAPYAGYSPDELKKLKDDDLQKQLTAMEMSRAGKIWFSRDILHISNIIL